MARITSLVCKMEHQLQDVLNIFWYRSEEVGLPTTTDLQTVHDAWMAEVWPAWAGILTNYVGLKQVIVQGYNDAFERVPYLPLIVDHTEVGLLNLVPGPPIQCAILSTRVEPQENGYRGVYPGPYVRTPVRRGYFAVSGMPDVYHEVSGRMSATFLNGAPAAAARAAVADTLNQGSDPTPWVPIRVSQPPGKTNLRGWGFLKDAKWSPLVSARRSRKVGQGAR